MAYGPSTHSTVRLHERPECWSLANAIVETTSPWRLPSPSPLDLASCCDRESHPLCRLDRAALMIHANQLYIDSALRYATCAVASLSRLGWEKSSSNSG